MPGRTQVHARALLDRNVEAFARLGFRDAGRPAPLETRLRAPGRPALALRMVRRGRFFGGTYALEVATSEPVLPTTRGLEGRGRGVVRLSRIAFRASGGDEAGRRLAERLERNEALARALAAVHFERIRVEPDGRAAIRHVGGSLVWVLFPPLVRPVPLIEEQAEATARALTAFAEAGKA